MIGRLLLIVLLVLASCAASVPPAPPRQIADIPAELMTCPAPPPEPPLLPPIVTTDRLKSGFHALDVARQAERRRGDICAERLEQLNLWIRETR
jgi:hypothetical protein